MTYSNARVFWFIASDRADLPGHSVAVTSACMTKLKHFDEIGTRGKHFPNEFLEMVYQLSKGIVIH